MKPTIGTDNIHTYNVYHVFIAPTILIQTLEMTVVTQAMASESIEKRYFPILNGTPNRRSASYKAHQRVCFFLSYQTMLRLIQERLGEPKAVLMFKEIVSSFPLSFLYRGKVRNDAWKIVSRNIILPST